VGYEEFTLADSTEVGRWPRRRWRGARLNGRGALDRRYAVAGPDEGTRM